MTTFLVEKLAFPPARVKQGEFRPVDIPKDVMLNILGAEPEDREIELLEQIFRFGQNDFQPKPHYSVSVGDVAFVNNQMFRCESVGWKKLSIEEYLEYRVKAVGLDILLKTK